MSLTRVINLAAAHWLRETPPERHVALRDLWRDPFDYELTEDERARAERKRAAFGVGALDGRGAVRS